MDMRKIMNLMTEDDSEVGQYAADIAALPGATLDSDEVMDAASDYGSPEQIVHVAWEITAEMKRRRPGRFLKQFGVTNFGSASDDQYRAVEQYFFDWAKRVGYGNDVAMEAIDFLQEEVFQLNDLLEIYATIMRTAR
tara:strand:+ start:37739 stop:38149 length:411 start_codon:yes stop_codon:yes gene_type:complete